MIVDSIGYLAGGITAVCFVPQVWQTYRTKKAEDVSFWMLVLSLLGVVLYEIYAVLLMLTPVVIMNGIFLALVIIELCLKLTFDRKKDPAPAP